VTPRVHAWATALDACFDYRVRLPLSRLEAAGWQVSASAGPPEPGDADVVVGCRLAGANQTWLDLCADPNVLTIYDADDDLAHIDPANEVPYGIYAPVADATLGLMAAADAVTVCTEWTAEVLHKVNKQVFLLPVCMDPSLLVKREPTSPPTVGFAGSPFHHQNWVELAPRLPELAAAEPDLDFVTIGGDFTGGAFGSRLHVQPMLGWAAHVARLDFDIGLAPLRRSEWNRGKSWTKPLEYAARGIPVVAEFWGQYPRWVTHGENGLFVYHAEDWVPTIRDLLHDDDARRDMSRAAFARAQEQTIDRHIDRWVHVYGGSW